MEKTDRELLDILLSHLNYQQTIVNQKNYVELQNGCFSDNIVFEFDENGKITYIYC